MKSKNVVQLHEVNTHTKESIKTTRSKCGGLFVRIIFLCFFDFRAFQHKYGIWMDFGASWGPPGHLLGRLGASWGRLGGVLARLGGVLGRLESVLARLGVLGGILGRLGGVLGSKIPPR